MPARSGPVKALAEVLRSCPVGAYQHLVLEARELARRVAVGQFVAVAAGQEPTSTLLRRAFSVHRADPGAGTVEIVVAAHGVGSSWVTRRRPGDRLDLVGPLGQRFPIPEGAGRAVLVGGGYGSAPLIWLAEVLRDKGFQVDVVLGAGSADRLFGVDVVRGALPAGQLHVTTEDGSAGRRGMVTDALPGLLGGAVTVYACGPMGMLRAVHGLAAAAGAATWLTVEESMACGIGVCMTCVLPVLGDDGVTRMTRTCTQGPTFAGDTVCWDAIGKQLPGLEAH